MHVSHILEPTRQILSVPTVSLISELSGFGVYEVDASNKVIEKYVVTGGAYNDNTAIISGITVGDQVIVEGQGKVQPGQQVVVSHS